MAQLQERSGVVKRGPGRPPKNAVSGVKKLNTPSSTATPQRATAPAAESPFVESPIPAKTTASLPSRVSDARPLPSLSRPQPSGLSSDEYQTIAASTVLATSLDRSRQQWTCDGVFQRYWVKPETGKHAKPPPPNNPEAKWMKMEGPCRLRIEPHIFEADVYIEKKPRLAQPKQYVQTAGQSPYGQPYRPHLPQNPNYGPTQQHPNTAPPHMSATGMSSSSGPGANLPPQQNMGQIHPPPRPQQPPPAQEKKASPDPVISMLANRASSDPELKALMKEVATGNASQEQLRVFQKHIDELTALIQKQRKEEEERSAQSQQPSVIQYDGPAEQHGFAAPQKPSTPQPRPQNYAQPAWTPPAPPPTNLPVILAFTNQGASEDRFLFPEHSILESLSPQHLLVSFIVTRKGQDAADPTGLDPDTEYWQPVTMMVEVAYGREEILAHIRRWVQSPDIVRKHMEEVMDRCQRAPQTHLALRLPFKGSAAAMDSGSVSKEGTPTIEALAKQKSATKYAKKSALATPRTAKAAEGESGTHAEAAPKPAETDPVSETKTSTEPPADASQDATALAAAAEPGADAQPVGESGRPRRAVRKSVRISEG